LRGGWLVVVGWGNEEGEGCWGPRGKNSESCTSSGAVVVLVYRVVAGAKVETKLGVEAEAGGGRGTERDSEQR
jgi:hypothetical protein